MRDEDPPKQIMAFYILAERFNPESELGYDYDAWIRWWIENKDSLIEVENRLRRLLYR
ncbi:hypothetical protein JXM67_01330 [candidate division WOR-3 bacterium]|nr:hypothetical protein [candidate division WOR-3 bacterium]